MAKYTVDGRAFVSLTAEVEADSEDEARDKAEALFHDHAGVASGGEEEVGFVCVDEVLIDDVCKEEEEDPEDECPECNMPEGECECEDNECD